MTLVQFPTAPARDGKQLGMLLAIAVVILTVIFSVPSGRADPHYPDWARVTEELAARWPLVEAARYDPENHFVLVDIRRGVTESVALRLACDTAWPLLKGVDSTVDFALYKAPDRVIVSGRDCSSDP